MLLAFPKSLSPSRAGLASRKGKGVDILDSTNLVFRLSRVETQFPGVKSEPELTWKSDEFARRLRFTLPRELGNVVGAPSWFDCSAERSKARALSFSGKGCIKV